MPPIVPTSFFLFFFYCYGHPPDLHSFPTRRSSDLIALAGGDAISVDWRLPIDTAWDIIGDDFAIQGNLDPTVLLAGRDATLRKARDVLDRVGGRPGHIFNLGHGILPGTDHDVIRALVDFVHEYESTAGA